MRYKLLGHSGLRVSEICLGTMTFGSDWGWGADFDDSKKVFETFAEAGGNFIDTANRYTNGTSEKYVGELTAADRDHFVIATKYTLSSREGDPNASGNHRKNLMQSVEASLRRLKTDRIDLLWVHAWDFTTRPEEVMRALDDLVRLGKVYYIGISDTPAWVVAQANTLAELRGWSRFVGLQIEYSLIERTPERELLPMARALDLAITPWGALGGGVLTGKYLKNDDSPKRMQIDTSSARFDQRATQIAQTVVAIATELGLTAGQVALAWVRSRSPQIIPIVGARSAAQIADSLGVLAVSLPATALTRLDDVSRVPLGFPHEFLHSPGVRNVVTGGTFDLIDNHRA